MAKEKADKPQVATVALCHETDISETNGAEHGATVALSSGTDTSDINVSEHVATIELIMWDKMWDIGAFLDICAMWRLCAVSNGFVSKDVLTISMLKFIDESGTDLIRIVKAYRFGYEPFLGSHHPHLHSAVFCKLIAVCRQTQGHLDTYRALRSMCLDIAGSGKATQRIKDHGLDPWLGVDYLLMRSGVLGGMTRAYDGLDWNKISTLAAAPKEDRPERIENCSLWSFSFGIHVVLDRSIFSLPREQKLFYNILILSHPQAARYSFDAAARLDSICLSEDLPIITALCARLGVNHDPSSVAGRVSTFVAGRVATIMQHLKNSNEIRHQALAEHGYP